MNCLNPFGSLSSFIPTFTDGAFSRLAASIRQLLGLPTWDSTGKLIPGLWSDGRSSDILLPDNEGQLVAIDGDHLPYEGARWVENLVDDSGGWADGLLNTGVVVTPLGDGAENIFLNGQTSYAVRKAVIESVQTYNRTYLFTIELKGTGSDIGKNVQLRVQRAAGTFTNTSVEVTLTGEYVRYVVEHTPGNADNYGLNVIVCVSGDPATDVQVRFTQVENVTGRLVSYPSEYQQASAVLDGIAVYRNELSNVINHLYQVVESKWSPQSFVEFPDIVVIGDSLVYESEGLQYLETLMLNTVIDKGIGGNSLGDMEVRFAADVVALSPDKVIIQGGINDVISDRTLLQMQTPIISMCDAAVANSIDVVLGSLSPFKLHGAWTEARQTALDEFNSWLLGYASANGYAFLDRYTLLEDPANPNTVLPRYTVDYLHLTVSGDRLDAWGYATLLNPVSDNVGAHFTPAPSLKHTPASTNLLPYSYAFDGPAWAKYNASVESDVINASYTDALGTRLIDDDSSGSDLVFIHEEFSLPGAGDCTISIYGKADQLSWLMLHATSFDTAPQCYFDLVNGVVGTATAGSVGRIEVLSNGWCRCSLSFESTTDLTGFFRVYVANADTSSIVDLDGTSSIYIYGAQAEASAAATPLIITAGASMPRDAVAVQYPYSSYVVNHDEGYAVFDWGPQYDPLAGGRGLLSFSDATSGVIYDHFTANYLATHDGTSARSLLEAHIAGRRYRIVARWSTELNEKQIGVLDIDGDGNWNWSTTNSYDGEFAYGSVINLFKGNDQVNKLHDLQIYDKDQTTEQIEARHGVVVAGDGAAMESPLFGSALEEPLFGSALESPLYGAIALTYLADFSDLTNSFLIGAV